MPKIDTIDEYVINALPVEVFKDILDEYSAVTHWVSSLELKPRRKSLLIVRVQFVILLLVIMGGCQVFC